MAIQNKTLRGAEHDWFATRSGLASTAPLSEHKSKYFSDKGFGGSNKPLTQMEREWLQNVASSSSNKPGDLWREVVAALSLTPTASQAENQLIFYTQVATSP